MNRSSFLTLIILLFSLPLLHSSCASAGPKVTRADRQLQEQKFNIQFLKAAEPWLPRVYRVGYQLVRSPVPGHSSKKPDYGFLGIGVIALEDYVRDVYGIQDDVKGVVVMGAYPGSQAEGLDLQRGDVITHFDGKSVKNLGQYFKRVNGTPDEKVVLRLWRQGESVEVEVPVEQVFYNAKFFLAAIPKLKGGGAYSSVDVSLSAVQYCKNDDELSLLMGHELAHITLKHSTKALGAGGSASIAYSAVAGLINAVTIPGVGTVIVHPFRSVTDTVLTKRYDREADYYGMKHAFHSQFDVEHGTKLFERLATENPSIILMAYTPVEQNQSSDRYILYQKIVEEFKTDHADRFPLTTSADWEKTILVKSDETVQEALERAEKESSSVQKVNAGEIFVTVHQED